ncbi:origin recognition complex subunit 2-like isoform X2 [Amphibalanus amphitrite]|uniref:origin recognition complex subunit 2-like isoform X2 n=1 Tax=Amphibalanus amphitrite TaxID=1232801 RepID=UPI001C9003FF|nr:origin recognition complex subunit 2-like isoform X2 [Amphibalanus amphitrite]
MNSAGRRTRKDSGSGDNSSRTMRTRQDSTIKDINGVLSVRFLDDADALEKICCISKTAPKMSRVGELLRNSQHLISHRAETPMSVADPDSESEPESPPAQPNAALTELNSAQLEVEDTVRGTAVFGFQRCHRRSHLRRVAEEFAQKSPVKTSAVDIKLPGTPRRGCSGLPASIGSGRRGGRRPVSRTVDDRNRSRSRSRSPPPARSRSRSKSRSRSRSPPPPQRNGRTPSTPKSAAGRTPQTPRGRASAALPTKTPQTVRRKVKLRLSKLKQEDIAVSDDDDDSDVSPLEDSSEDEYKAPLEEEEDDDEESEEEDEEGEEEEQTSTVPPAAVRGRGGAPRRRPELEPAAVSAEDYFSLHSAGGPTSNHTLSRLSEPRLSGAALRALLDARPTDHAAERAALLTDLEIMFPHWLAAVSHGFNILLHGLGSKRDVLERLRRQHLRERLHMVVSGYHPSVTPRQLLLTLLEEALDVPAPPSKLEAQLEAVERRLAAPGAPALFLLVHSIDGPMMRAEKMQYVLARLAQLPRVHLLASADHINSPLVWDQHKLAQFNFLWFDATTLLPYTEETSYENSLLVRQTADLALSSLRHVFKSLTPNARGIFILLAKNQVERASDKTFDGMPLSELYQRCRDAFLVSSQVALRAQLTEFRDHKLIRTRQSHDGVEQLTVPLEAALISEFLASCEDS